MAWRHNLMVEAVGMRMERDNTGHKQGGHGLVEKSVDNDSEEVLDIRNRNF